MGELPSIQQLENFITYGRIRNFTIAAKEANITQSAFSFQMQKLETVLGVKLIARSNRGSKLTPEGEMFFLRLNSIMTSLTEAVYDVRNFNANNPLDLKIGVLTSLGDVLMNQHVAYFSRNNSNIYISVYTMEEEDLLQALKNGSIDIGSTFLPSDIKVNGYEKDCFCIDNVVYYAPNVKNLTGEISITRLLDVPLVRYPPKYFMNAMIDQYFAQINELPPVAANLSTPYAMINYCQQNQVGALLAERLLTALGVENGYYVINPLLNLKAYLLYKKKNPKYKMMKVFIDYVINLNKKSNPDRDCL